jgi:NAD-dependent dihydropyrimidine dehydrogenase PreA subunit
MIGMKYIKGGNSLLLDSEKCNGCAMCTIVCPHAVFVISGKKSHIRHRDLCMECGACAMNCPVGAIAVKSGVGCAIGIITGAIRGTEPVCECSGGCC